MQRAPAAPAAPVRAPRELSDPVGFALFIGLALLTGARHPEISLLLAPVLLYELTVAASFLIRGRAVRTSVGVPQRLAAYGRRS